ncbi:MAG: hypothetical protein HY749_16030 [Gammaproteobacteria bacterium]|nr:hypothetical protein [Gammaproteobacteria bacterium]
MGLRIRTQPMGEYPGGVATISRIYHDPAAPDIVFMVRNPEYRRGAEIGVFEHEDVELLQ